MLLLLLLFRKREQVGGGGGGAGEVGLFAAQRKVGSLTQLAVLMQYFPHLLDDLVQVFCQVLFVQLTTEEDRLKIGHGDGVRYDTAM